MVEEEAIVLSMRTLLSDMPMCWDRDEQRIRKSGRERGRVRACVRTRAQLPALFPSRGSCLVC